MKLKLSFKVHFYSCIRSYIVFGIFLLLSIGLKYIFNIDDNIYLSYIITSGCLFSIMLGIYEYLMVLHTYLNFHPNPRAFWLQSIFANLINSLLCLLVTIIINLILLIISNTPLLVDNMSQILILYIFAYSIGSIGYVLLHKVKYFQIIVIIILVICLIFLGNIINKGLLDFISFYLSNKLICLIPLLLSIIFDGLILLRLKRFIK